MKRNKIYRTDIPAEENTKKYLHKVKGLVTLQPGEQKTGFEIIASLPLEEQQEWNNIYKVFNDPYTAPWRLLTQIYRWNGKEWEL